MSRNAKKGIEKILYAKREPSAYGKISISGFNRGRARRFGFIGHIPDQSIYSPIGAYPFGRCPIPPILGDQAYTEPVVCRPFG
jgi:hypothetical protein